MLKNGLLLGLGLLFAVALIIAFPVAGEVQAQAGGNFVLVNFIGQDITLDLDDITYTVPGTNINPEGGRFELQLASGEHKYAVTVAAVGGSAGEFTIEPGGLVAKAVHIVTGDPVVDKDGILLVKPRDKVEVFDFDPSATAQTDGLPVADTWQPVTPAPGLGSIVWVNYSGADELTVDLAGQLYKVAPQNHGIPGRLQVDIPAGFYRYTASVPYGSINGELSLGPGEVIGVNVIPDIREEPEYKVGEEFEIPPVTLNQFQESLTARVSQPGTVPAALPAAGDNVATPTEIEAPVVAAGLLVKNYTGDTVVFTIDNQAYLVPDNSEAAISFSTPGSYNYTASLPYVATTGTVNVAEDRGVELSIAINLARDFLSVYQN